MDLGRFNLENDDCPSDIDQILELTIVRTALCKALKFKPDVLTLRLERGKIVFGQKRRMKGKRKEDEEIGPPSK